MFERFTERARRVLFFARYEAIQLGSVSIEPEHLALGLIREGKGLTARLMSEAQVPLAKIRTELAAPGSGRQPVSTSIEIPFSVTAKRVLQYAADEADRLRHNYIGTEHLLLGVLREERALPATVLRPHGVTLAAARDFVERHHEEDAAGAAGQARGRVGMSGGPLPANTHIVLVQVTVRPEMLPEFEAALLHNARESLAKDAGCLRFDVSQDTEDPRRWVMHEVYTEPSAHAAHRQAPHFLAYNEVAERAVVEKTVTKLVGRHVP